MKRQKEERNSWENKNIKIIVTKEQRKTEALQTKREK